jgi:sensor c-di-GMP phosphodiesterase-like protein
MRRDLHIRSTTKGNGVNCLYDVPVAFLANGNALREMAEYVENEAIADAVRRLGVDYAQGYTFGRPEPLDEVLASLGRDESRRLHK